MWIDRRLYEYKEHSNNQMFNKTDLNNQNSIMLDIYNKHILHMIYDIYM